MTDSKKKRSRRRFSDEFKREAVELFQGSGISADQVSAELGISTSLLYRWSRELSTEQVETARPAYEDLASENRRLRREVEFLKKASSYFASQQSNGTGS